MREYGKVYATFWSSELVAKLSDAGKLLALYLMTSQHTTLAGVFRLPDGYAAEDTGWTPDRLHAGFAELAEQGFALRCERTKWVWIVGHLAENPPENPNQRKAASRQAEQVPDTCCWKADFLRASADALGLSQPLPNRSETVPEPFRNQIQEQIQIQKQETEAAPAPAVAADRQPAKPAALVLPEWLDPDTWAGFVDMRKRIKHPLTDRAAVLILREAEKLRLQGHDPNAAIDTSTRNGWRDVFAPKPAAANRSDLFGGQHQRDGPPPARRLQELTPTRRALPEPTR